MLGLEFVSEGSQLRIALSPRWARKVRVDKEVQENLGTRLRAALAMRSNKELITTHETQKHPRVNLSVFLPRRVFRVLSLFSSLT